MSPLQPFLENKRHVIWDWNGTLLADLDLALTAVNALLKEEGLSAITESEYKQHFGFPVVDYYKKLGFDTEPEAFRRLCDRFHHHFVAGLNDIDLWPGARELLTEVKSQGMIQSVLSASEQNLLNESLRLFGVEDLFDFVHGIGDKAAHSKVESGHQLMARVSVPKEATLLIGDTDHDLEVAEALGVDALLVEHGHQSGTKLRAIHPHVIRLF